MYASCRRHPRHRRRCARGSQLPSSRASSASSGGVSKFTSERRKPRVRTSAVGDAGRHPNRPHDLRAGAQVDPEEEAHGEADQRKQGAAQRSLSLAHEVVREGGQVDSHERYERSEVEQLRAEIVATETLERESADQGQPRRRARRCCAARGASDRRNRKTWAGARRFAPFRREDARRRAASRRRSRRSPRGASPR